MLLNSGCVSAARQPRIAELTMRHWSNGGVRHEPRSGLCDPDGPAQIRDCLASVKQTEQSIDPTFNLDHAWPPIAPASKVRFLP